MNTILMNSINSKTSDPHRLLRNLTEKINLKRSDKCVSLSNLSRYYTWKHIKESYKKTIKKQQVYNISSDVDWRVSITWWAMFCIRYSWLF